MFLEIERSHNLFGQMNILCHFRFKFIHHYLSFARLHNLKFALSLGGQFS